MSAQGSKRVPSGGLGRVTFKTLSHPLTKSLIKTSKKLSVPRKALEVKFFSSPEGVTEQNRTTTKDLVCMCASLWMAGRVRKYAKFGVFYTKIVQMTPLRLQRESLRLQKFSVTNTVLSLPFSQQIQFTLIVNVVNLNQIIKIKELYCTTKQEEGNFSMTSIMDLSFPDQLTATATSCIPHDSVYSTCEDHMLESLKNGFFPCDTWLQKFQNDSKILWSRSHSDSTHQ